MGRPSLYFCIGCYLIAPKLDYYGDKTQLFNFSAGLKANVSCEKTVPLEPSGTELCILNITESFFEAEARNYRGRRLVLEVRLRFPKNALVDPENRRKNRCSDYSLGSSLPLMTVPLSFSPFPRVGRTNIMSMSDYGARKSGRKYSPPC